MATIMRIDEAWRISEAIFQEGAWTAYRQSAHAQIRLGRLAIEGVEDPDLSYENITERTLTGL